MTIYKGTLDCFKFYDRELTEKEKNTIIARTRQFGKSTSILIPMVRRMYPKLLAQEIVGVQPMTELPKGWIMERHKDGCTYRKLKPAPIVPDHFFRID